jgi:hypothetical protein
MRTLGFVLGFGIASATLVACSSHNSTTGATADGGGAGASCASPVTPASNDYCASCTFASSANPSACQSSRPINACCAWVQEPRQEAARASGLHYFAATDGNLNVDVGCLGAPASLGASKAVTLQGYVKLFASGNDSQGVKIEIFKEGPNGALGDSVGTPYVTTGDDAKDPPQMPLPTWSTKCPTEGCKLRSFSVDGVPTETPLIIKTSDATGTGNTWSDLYDYNIYFSNGSLDAQGLAHYDTSAVAATDVNTVAATVGFTIKSDKGLLAGEVHDCGDVRISGAMVDTDLPHEGDMFYFGENEADPLPDRSRAPQGLGTSKLGLFGALNFPTGAPIRISALVKHGGVDTLIGTYTVQAFPGAVTALSLRGRRPWQTK